MEILIEFNPLVPKRTKMYVFGFQLKIWKGYFSIIFFLIY